MYRRYIAFVCRCFFNVKDYEVPETAFLCVCTMILKGKCFCIGVLYVCVFNLIEIHYIGVLYVCVFNLIEIQSEHLKTNVNLHDSLGALSTKVLHTYERRDFVHVCTLLYIACFIFFIFLHVFNLFFSVCKKSVLLLRVKCILNDKECWSCWTQRVS